MFLSRGHVTADPSEQAEQLRGQHYTGACTHNYTCIQARANVSLLAWEWTSFTSTYSELLTHYFVSVCADKTMCVHQEEQHIERTYTQMHVHKPAHSLCLSQLSLSLTKGQWCVKLRCAACDSINEWIALSIESMCACICVCPEHAGINTPFDPLLRITQCYGWICIYMCVCVWER